MTYGFCVYHEIECDYKGSCINCPHNTAEDTEWFRQDEERFGQDDTLDKIRYEIEQLPTNYIEIQRPHSVVGRDVVELGLVMQIIDKYRKGGAE